MYLNHAFGRSTPVSNLRCTRNRCYSKNAADLRHVGHGRGRQSAAPMNGLILRQSTHEALGRRRSSAARRPCARVAGERMTTLGTAITESVVHHYGRSALLRG